MEAGIIALTIFAMFGVIGYKMAEKRGRSRAAGTIGGTVFGVFAILYYLIAGETEEKKVEREVKLQQDVDARINARKE